jgi:hypothetical protein
MVSASGQATAKGKTMKKFAYLLVSLVCGFATTSVWAVCVDLSQATNWSNINTHKIIMYRGNKAIAVLDIPSCDIYPSANIRLDKANVCNGDNIIVSGVACRIRNIEKP